MSFWDVSNPVKPTGIKDPNAILDYPISFVAWLADIADTYVSHTVVSLTGGLAVNSSAQSAGIITVWLSGGTVGETGSFTVRIVTTGGRTDDRTFWLKIKER
jgi:hypothetical protein